MILSLVDFDKQRWQSLERTRKFYEKALSSEFDILYEGTPDKKVKPDAIVNFVGDKYWRIKHPDCSLLFGMHGGIILNQDFLFKHLTRLETTDVLIVNCSSDITILERMLPKTRPKFCLLPLPVDIRIFKPMDRDRCRQSLGIPKADIYMGFVSRLLPQKNLHQFLFVIGELKKRFPDKKIIGIIVGDYWVDYPVLNYVTEDYPSKIKSLINKLKLQSNIVYFPSKLTHEELANCYNVMDLLLHPTNSIDENFGYAPVEAMACGTPVIGTAYGGLKDTILDDVTGILVPTWTTVNGIRFDLNKFVKSSANLLSNKNKRAKLAANAVRHVHEKYTYSGATEILCTAVKEAVRDRRAGNNKIVKVVRKEILTEPSTFLPTIKTPWHHYRRVVNDYTSKLSSKLDKEVYLYTPPYLNESGKDQFSIDDPAWPCSFQLTHREAIIVRKCRKPTRLKSLLNSNKEIADVVQKLVELGILIFSEK
jgi:glycosyltransferase involved in cell wall biosynthesis